MERVLKPASRLVAAAVAVIGGAIVLYLGALLNVYVIGWVVQLLDKIF
jgi:hypothetical protein